ncbi:hypothetical protein [Oerskovia sp. Root22]|uniref:hypothetical protein n=1 Tax=Oerskovia sp. Root22 TaxID=1736494 RepID=UPI0006F69C85|nr:hypothetical protein [Oerskovia sp. Root22]KRC37507.1 hypothetical protein ASE15_05180 [Oerskovia sp. Root22]
MTSPKPTTPADPNDLRTALTKLADDAEEYGPGAWVAGEIRTLLAAHPAPETDGVCGNCLGHGVETCAAHPAPASDTLDDDSDLPWSDTEECGCETHEGAPDTGREDDELVEAVARTLSRSEHPGVQAYIDARAVLAALLAPPVVDETEIAARAIEVLAEETRRMPSDWTKLRTWMRDYAARLRGATR